MVEASVSVEVSESVEQLLVLDADLHEVVPFSFQESDLAVESVLAQLLRLSALSQRLFYLLSSSDLVEVFKLVEDDPPQLVVLHDLRLSFVESEQLASPFDPVPSVQRGEAAVGKSFVLPEVWRGLGDEVELRDGGLGADLGVAGLVEGGFFEGGVELAHEFALVVVALFDVAQFVVEDVRALGEGVCGGRELLGEVLASGLLELLLHLHDESLALVVVEVGLVHLGGVEGLGEGVRVDHVLLEELDVLLDVRLLPLFGEVPSLPDPRTGVQRVLLREHEASPLAVFLIVDAELAFLIAVVVVVVVLIVAVV